MVINMTSYIKWLYNKMQQSKNYKQTYYCVQYIEAQYFTYIQKVSFYKLGR